MSLFGGVADFLTGGRDEQSEQALNEALASYGAVQAPTQAQLSLPELQQYVNAGLMTPAQMQAYLQQNNALATENTPQTGTAAQIAALNQLSGVANAGAAGTPVEQAQQAQTIQAMNEAIGGQRGAIEQAAQARGTPGGLVQSALANQTAGQEGQQAYQNALQSQAQAYQQAVNAMAQGGAAGQALQGQQNTQANTVAAAQNAMQQFNAANQQNAAAANMANQQAANTYNTENAQNLVNTNTQNANSRSAYNTQQAQTAFNDAMAKAQGMAGVYGQQAANYTGMGQQAAGVAGGLLNLVAPQPFTAQSAGSTIGGTSGGGGSPSIPMGSSAFGAGGTGGAGAAQAADSSVMMLARGGVVSDHSRCYHEGGICMERGGMVPGHPKVAGDSIRNDTVTAHVSPGEAVIPRTAVSQHMPEVLSLLSGGRRPPPPQHHPQDVAALLQAMRTLRGAA